MFQSTISSFKCFNVSVSMFHCLLCFFCLLFQCFNVSFNVTLKFHVSMFQCFNVSMFQCFNVSMFQRFNVSMFQCFIVCYALFAMLLHRNFEISCFNFSMFQCLLCYFCTVLCCSVLFLLLSFPVCSCLFLSGSYLCSYVHSYLLPFSCILKQPKSYLSILI